MPSSTLRRAAWEEVLEEFSTDCSASDWVFLLPMAFVCVCFVLFDVGVHTLMVI